jgi:hypothetical protein
MARFASTLFWICVSILIVLPVTAWSAAALWFRLPFGGAVAAGLFLVAGLATAAALFTARRWMALLVFALAFGAVLGWWSTIRPPADGDWAPDVARQTT